MIDDDPFVSVIIPVKDGAERLEACLQSLSAIDYPKHRIEVVVADGRSKDATRAVAAAHGAIVIDNPHELVASGRNAGFRAARGQVVAFTDDDCTFERGWVRNAVRHLRTEGIGGVGGPTRVPEAETAFGRAVGLFFRLGVWFARSVHAETVSGVSDATDLPGCNMFYRREALDAVMPIPETLITCEDVELGFRVRETGWRLRSVPDVAVWHHKRPTPKRFVRQMFRFARGRVQLARRRPGALRAAHRLAGFAIPMMLLAFPLTVTFCLPLFLAVAVAAFVSTRSAAVAVRAPYVLISGVCAWSWGFLRETVRPTPLDETTFDWSRHAG